MWPYIIGEPTESGEVDMKMEEKEEEEKEKTNNLKNLTLVVWGAEEKKRCLWIRGARWRTPAPTTSWWDSFLSRAANWLVDCPTQLIFSLYLDFYLWSMTKLKEHSREICFKLVRIKLFTTKLLPLYFSTLKSISILLHLHLKFQLTSYFSPECENLEHLVGDLLVLLLHHLHRPLGWLFLLFPPCPASSSFLNSRIIRIRKPPSKYYQP